MNRSLRVADYLDHILKAIDRIERFTAGMDAATFLESELVQDAVIRNIEIIGEASNSIRYAAPDFAARHTQIPWQVMVGMRNRVAHAYHTVDLEIVWALTRGALAQLREQVLAVRALAPHDET